MSLLASLRSATAEAHARLEAVMLLDADPLPLPRYGAALQVLLAVRQGWEPELRRWFPDLVQPHQVWLEQDLDVLGFQPLPATTRPDLTRGEAWGFRYVLEGSALGGRVLLRRAASLGCSDQAGARYFAVWGAETGPRWKNFLAALETAGPAAEVVAGAVRAFEELVRLASARFDEALDARQDLAPPLATVEDAVMPGTGLQVLQAPIRRDGAA